MPTFPSYMLQRAACFRITNRASAAVSMKRPRDDTDDANSLSPPHHSLSSHPTTLQQHFPPPLPFSFDILKRITLRGPAGDRTFYWEDELVHVMFDAFPKASVHLLILPKDTSIDTLEVLADRVDADASSTAAASVATPSTGEASATTIMDAVNRNKSLQLLEHMIGIGNSIVALIKSTEPSLHHLTFQLGFHSVPSLKHLHMHVMSQDFERGPALKNKKHYLSFCTAFFLHASTVLLEFKRLTMLKAAATTSNNSTTAATMLPMRHQVTQWRSAGAIIEGSHEMKCFWCGMAHKTMPALTSHLGSCTNNRCRP
ncbi:scavenger mRNA-decapping enzyme, putative [Bodo saltans]|uniref:Scavenger mRNA-decapping enzyme, putative n=1 Tax=Bodo saltans TaxID=75058 RepID=A0A0S4JC46_BODSA|nr:scavenger mRNA-decapping enzyme, putative [Bodo saltans]|eukprot:CUG87553.1 scavenger mRNA-decapping enzyme, putative [Bodo saltans]